MKPAPLFHDHAVLQRDLPLPVWGTAGADDLISVSIAGHSVHGLADEKGRWLVRLPALAAGGPYDLVMKSTSAEVVAKDVLIGDVWICSGQSNMEWRLDQCEQKEHQEETAEPANIRLLTVSNKASISRRQEAVTGQWTIGTRESLMRFSAVGGWFGRKLQKSLNVPIGLICTAWGGTRIQAWMSREALMQDATTGAEVLRYESQLFATSPDEIKDLVSPEDWAAQFAPVDAGNLGLAQGWHLPKLDDTGWAEMLLPQRWQSAGHPGSGVFWFRLTVKIPEAWMGRELKLGTGAIDKHDDTWVNGQRVGGLSWENGPDTWCTPREYTVPAELTRAGRELTIAVRARSHAYDGGLIGPADKMRLQPVEAAAAEALLLTGNWRYAVEQDWGVVAIPPRPFGPGNPNTPYILFDSRVAPLLPYGIRGVIWYQGESNVTEAALYRRLMPALMRDWRRVWGQGDFPFLQVQLANYKATAEEPEPSDWAELREAQLLALSEPASGLAVAIDVGDEKDIHPKDKYTVGDRLARWALAEMYGRGGVPSGPLYSHWAQEAKGRIRIFFRHATGLHTRDGLPPKHVAIAGPDKVFIWAHAAVESATLVVWHPDIAQPAAIRYAWANNPATANLVNGEDLPASPFRTDNW